MNEHLFNPESDTCIYCDAGLVESGGRCPVPHPPVVPDKPKVEMTDAELLDLNSLVAYHNAAVEVSCDFKLIVQPLEKLLAAEAYLKERNEQADGLLEDIFNTLTDLGLEDFEFMKVIDQHLWPKE